MVREFYEGADLAVGGGFDLAPLWQRLMDEEAQELRDAIAAGDPVETADAIADSCYAIIGLAVALGIPFDRVFAEVHRSNMTKLIPPITRRPDGKILKGPAFEPPRIAEVLAA